MKTQTQSFKKKIMWYEVKKLSSTKGNSDNKIAQLLGIDRRTVSKYKKMSESEFKSFIDKKRVYSKLLDPYYFYVKRLLELDNSLPAAVIEDRLKENHLDLPIVNSKTVYNFVKYVREKEHIFASSKIRQTAAIDEVPYGSQAQIDFGEHTMRCFGKSIQKVYFFALVLSRSRFKYVFFQTQPFTGKTAVESHERAFEYIEGIPNMLLYDQDSVYLKSENLGDYILADDFHQYRNERNINVSFCRKADPQTKGKIENVIGYIKHNFLRARTFYDIDRLNEEALAWLKRTANGTPHSTTKKLPGDEWIIEKDYLKVFNPTSIILKEKLPEYTVRKDNTVSYRGCFYRVPYGTYNGKGTTVFLSTKEETISLYNHQSNLIAEHNISKEKGKIIGGTSYMRDRTSELNALKENALWLRPNCDVFADYIEEIHKNKSRYFRDNLKIIREVIGEYNEELVGSALNYCIEHQLYNAFNLKEAAEYYRKLSSIRKESNINIAPLRKDVHMNHFKSSTYIPDTSNINQYNKILDQL